MNPTSDPRIMDYSGGAVTQINAVATPAPSAIDLVNTRRLILAIQEKIAGSAHSLLFPEDHGQPLQGTLMTYVESYLDELKAKKFLNQHSVKSWGEMQTPVTLKDARHVRREHRDYRAVAIYAGGLTEERHFRGMSWRKAKPRIRSFHLNEKYVMRMGMTIAPVQAQEWVSIRYVVKTDTAYALDQQWVDLAGKPAGETE